jgi:tetratricopeptide (TPR) repeat protein
VNNPSKRGAYRAICLALLVLVPTAAIVAAAFWRLDPALAEAERRLEAGSPDGALESANAILARYPGNGGALSLKARALADLGRWNEAGEIFSQISVRSPAEIKAWATVLVNRQRWNEAMPLLARLLERNPSDPFALRHVTTCQFQLGRAGAALDSAARLATIRGHEVEGFFLSGVIQRAQGNTYLAIENWGRIEALRPSAEGLPIGPAEFFLIYGEDLLTEGTPETAISKLRKSQELEETIEVLLRLGQAYALTGNEAEAAAAWTKAIERDAGNQEARNGLAELALGHSDGDEALRWLTPTASSPGVSSTTAYLMERAHTLLGNEDELVRWQRRTAELRGSEKHQAALKRKFRSGL